MSCPVSSAQPQGSYNSAMAGLFTGSHSLFGQKPKAMHHEVGFNDREFSIPNTPADGHVSEVRVNLPSNFGHLIHRFYVTFDFDVDIDLSAIRAAAGSSGTAIAASSAGILARKKLLENIQLLPMQGWSMLEYMQLEHNSTQIQKLTGQDLQEMLREGYGLQDQKLMAHQVNGQQFPKYHTTFQGTTISTTTPESGLKHNVLGAHVNRTGNTVEQPANTLTNTQYLNRATTVPGQYRGQCDEMAYLAAQITGDGAEEATVWDRYISEWYHEIGLKDLTDDNYSTIAKWRVLLNNGGDGTSLNTVKGTTDIVRLRLPIMCEIPWFGHYNISDALPILNLNNDPTVTLKFRPYKQWIQNYKYAAGASASQPYFDLKCTNFKLLAKYYDLPQNVWRSMFPMNRQMHWPTPHMIYQNLDTTINFGTQSTTEVELSLEHHDRNARYIKVFVQSRDHLPSDDTNFSSTYLIDAVDSVYVEVGNDLLLTKIKTPAKYLLNQNESMFFGSHKSPWTGHCKGTHWKIPLALDSSYHEPGGGSVDLRPVFNSSKLKIVFNKEKLEFLYNSQIPMMRKEDLSADTLSSYKNADGSAVGMITRAGTAPNYTYSINARITTVTNNLGMITLDNGQLFDQR